MAIWHTSDFHLDHAKVIQFDGRPDRSVAEMNERIVASVNATVQKDDIMIYHGDLMYWKYNSEAEYNRRFAAWIQRFNCHKNMIYVAGNHDRVWRKSSTARPNWGVWDLFKRDDNGRPYYQLHPMGYELRLSRSLCDQHGLPESMVNFLVVCTHYSHRVWNRSHRGTAINLYGHSHGSLSGLRNSFDVGFNVWNRPVSLLEIVEKHMPEHNSKNPPTFGHHGREAAGLDE
jgi:calcineurin-like phosphoesterase family protein